MFQNCAVFFTFYPNFPIFLHRYICHICDILQLCLFIVLIQNTRYKSYWPMKNSPLSLVWEMLMLWCLIFAPALSRYFLPYGYFLSTELPFEEEKSRNAENLSTRNDFNNLIYEVWNFKFDRAHRIDTGKAPSESKDKWMFQNVTPPPLLLVHFPHLYQPTKFN